MNLGEVAALFRRCEFDGDFVIFLPDELCEFVAILDGGLEGDGDEDPDEQGGGGEDH